MNFFNTQAESFISLAAQMVIIRQETLENFSVTRIIELEGAQIVNQLDDSENEVAPGGHEPAECDYILYQFKDGSQIWYVRTPTKDYLQLRGIYNGKFRHTTYVTAGEQVRDLPLVARKSYPAIWDEDVRELGLTVRATNCLLSENIYHIGDLVARTPKQIKEIPSLGKGSFSIIMEALEARGLALETNVSDWIAAHRQ